MDDMMLEFMLQDKSVAADVAMKPGDEATCEKCGKYAISWELTVTRVFEGGKKVSLDSELGKAIIAYVLEKAQHRKPLCTDCWDTIMEKEFPDHD